MRDNLYEITIWVDADEADEAMNILTKLMDSGEFPNSDVISAIPFMDDEES